VEWWLSILRHSAEYSQDYINTLAAKGIIIPDVVKKGFERLSYHKWNPDMQKEYRLQVEDREEFEAMYAVERTEGKKEGEKTAKIEIAQKMLRRGRPLGEIMEDTGLTTEEIEAIRDGSTS
jgi:predicted transposase/invertase (TIGR01784 family)